MKKLLIVATFIAVLASAPLAFAGHNGKGERAEVLPQLNLSQEQKEIIRAKQEAFDKEVVPIRVELLSKKAEIRYLWTVSPLDKKRIKSVENEIHDLRGRLQTARTEFRFDVYDVLEPEQRTELLLTLFKWRHGHKRSGRGFGPPASDVQEELTSE